MYKTKGDVFCSSPPPPTNGSFMLVYDLKRSLLLDSSPDSPLSVYVPHAWHPSDDTFREFFHFIIVVLFFLARCSFPQGPWCCAVRRDRPQRKKTAQTRFPHIRCFPHLWTLFCSPPLLLCHVILSNAVYDYYCFDVGQMKHN